MSAASSPTSAPSSSFAYSFAKKKEDNDVVHVVDVEHALMAPKPCVLAPLVFVSSSEVKFSEVQKLLSEWNKLLTWRNLDLPWKQDNDLETVAIARVRAAYELVKQPCFVDVASLTIASTPDDDESTCLVLDRPIAMGESTVGPGSFHQVGEEKCLRLYEGRNAESRLVLAYYDGENVDVFEGRMEGKIVAASGPPAVGWDRIFQPDGYRQTLAEMQDHKFLIAMRYRPYIEFASVLRGHTYTGLFESHVTVSTTRAGEQVPAEEMPAFIEQFIACCKEIRCKPLLIELPSGRFPTQLMTSCYHRGDLKKVHYEAYALSQQLIRAGFEVTRTKIEAMFSNRGVPDTDEAAASLSAENYFEFHLKIRLAEDRVGKLREICRNRPKKARLSQNAFKKLASGLQERFVTLRLYDMGKIRAKAILDRLSDDLNENGFHVIATQREYAVYDSNVRLDAGWIDRKQPPSVEAV